MLPELLPDLAMPDCLICLPVEVVSTMQGRIDDVEPDIFKQVSGQVRQIGMAPRQPEEGATQKIARMMGDLRQGSKTGHGTAPQFVPIGAGV